MGVYIKGVEPPTSCWFCLLRQFNVCYCDDAIILNYQSRPETCPLVPVPPHGRLVDADKLGFDMMDAANADQALAMVDDAPTVIEAEEGE